MSAEIHTSRHARLAKLAGPATGSYDGSQKMPSHKRKRDKAQDQLRSRMRHRMNGNGNSSAILNAKRRSALLEGKGDTSLSAGMRHSTNMEVTSRDLQGANYWRTQQERYNRLTQMEGGKQPRLPGSQNVPLQVLVDRVLHRQEQTLGLGSKVSPMTIRAYKPPVAPYAIQQSSHVKKIVKMKPIQRQDADDKGPFVLVLQRNGIDEDRTQPKARRRYHTRSSGDQDALATRDQFTSLGSNKVLPPVNAPQQREDSEPNTWRPELGQMHNPEVLPEAEDRSVTNYRLQLQQANKLAGSRFEFHHEVPSNQTVEEMTMQSLNPLPPIQSVYPGEGTGVEVDRTDSGNGETAEESSERQQRAASNSTILTNVDRTASKNEILNMKRAQKEAKRQKQLQADEYTLLRTRKRYTSKTKQFKDDLERARQLSAIQEDRLSLNSARLSRSSGQRTSMSASSSGSNPLNSIDETTDMNLSSGDDGSPRNIPGYSDNTLVLAPPTTPSTRDDHPHSDVIMNVDVMNSPMNDDSSAESNTEGTYLSSSQPSSSHSSPREDAEHIQTGDTNIADGMTWVNGERPFSDNRSAPQKPTPEHER